MNVLLAAMTSSQFTDDDAADDDLRCHYYRLEESPRKYTTTNECRQQSTVRTRRCKLDKYTININGRSYEHLLFARRSNGACFLVGYLPYRLEELNKYYCSMLEAPPLLAARLIMRFFFFGRDVMTSEESGNERCRRSVNWIAPPTQTRPGRAHCNFATDLGSRHIITAVAQITSPGRCVRKYEPDECCVYMCCCGCVVIAGKHPRLNYSRLKYRRRD